MSDEEPEDEVLQYYYRNYHQPVLVLTDADGGKYCFCYGFDGYTSVVSYTSIIERISGEYEEVLKTVRLELAKRNRNQAPFEENLNEVGISEYYDILVELNAKTISIDGGKTIWDKSGFWCTNYCSNNFVDCMRFGIGEVDTEGNSQAADRHIKQEYSAEQLLAFYQQGLDLQNRLIELYKRRHEISHSGTEIGITGGMNMNYDLSAVEMLKMLGYDQPTGREWLEKLKLEKQISLPKVYIEFMELMVDCPLLGTSNLWIGKMEHKTSANIPCTFYDQLQEMIDDRKNRWSKRPGRYERSLYDLFQLPVEEWSRMVDNYLVIGSDYAGGMGEFGIRIEELQKDDPPVYWHKDADSFSMWKLEHEKLSDFLLNVLIEALACVDYQSAEYELETKGWRYEEYFDLKKDDWVAGKSVLKRYGIDYSAIKKYKASSGKVFCCYDEDRKALFVGSTAEGEMSLSAINRNEAEHIFLDLDSLEYLFEEARLCIKDKEREDEISQYHLYTKTPKTKVSLSDYCQADKPPQKGEDGESICPATAKKEPLYVLCSGADFMEVITGVLQKKPKAANEELLEALNHYLQTGNL